MTAVDEFLAGKPPEPPRDQFGRYRLPHPETGKTISWTRATTWASTVSDNFGLEKWKIRMTAVGLARRPDLLLAVSAADPDSSDGKKEINKLSEAAQEHAGSTVRRTIGSALHSITEAHDAGRAPAIIPEPYDADLAAYVAAIEGAGIVIDPAHIERVVCVPELGVAGTFDRLVTLPDGRRVVADLKTGSDLSYSWTEIAVQLAIYSRASTIYDVITGTHEPMPEVDLEQALVMHLPVGEARCDLYMVDIAAGWDMASVCGTVRGWRKRKNLAAPYLVRDRSEWITDRLKAVAVHPDAKRYVVLKWPDGCPTKPPWTDPQADAIDAVLVKAEAMAGVPFHNGDPAVKAKRGPSRYEAAKTTDG
jgi:hypothetical protein